MKIKASRERKTLIFKNTMRWFIYIVIILMGFTFMMSGRLLKPVVLIPISICIAMNTKELQSAFTGTFCGFLIDIACGRIFGYNAVILTIICTLVSLLYTNYLRKKFINFFAIAFVSSFISGMLDYVFYYNIWDYENVKSVLYTITMPVFAYTVISALPVYLLFMLVNKFLMPERHLTIAEAIKINREDNSQ